MDRRVVDRRCEICADAYGTRYVCAECRADPANEGWAEEREEAVSDVLAIAAVEPMPWNEDARELPLMFKRVARLLITPMSYAKIADCLGCSVAYVRRVRAELP